MRLAVEPAEIVPPGPERPGDTVARGVLVVVGVRRGDDRQAELLGRLHAGDAERELGGDVHDVRPEAGQVVDHLAQPGERPLDVGVEEEWDAGRAVDLGAVRDARAGSG